LWTLYAQLNDVVVPRARYLNLDDCWQAMERDEAGNLQPDAERFPSGMKHLADYLHERKLKIGLYTDYGTKTCMGRPGSFGYEAADAKQFASWGVDSLKMDGCFKPRNASYDSGFPAMAAALNATGRPTLFSCSWPDYERAGDGPDALAHVNFTALRESCNIWRIYNDIQDSWWHVLDIARFWGEQQAVLAQAAGPGGFNDPDALIIGQRNLGVAGMQVQMSLWVTLAAPLLVGADLRSISADAKAVLQNADVLRIADDPLAKQGLRVDNRTEGLSIWRRELSNGDLAVLILNTLPFHANIHDPSAVNAYTLINGNGPHLGMGVSWDLLGWTKAQSPRLTVTDLWDGSKACCQGVAPDPPLGPSALAAFVPFGGCRFLRVSRAGSSVV
jgi:hypothetical protein